MHLSRFSISAQILIGYVPVFAILIFLAVSSYGYFKKFNNQFNQLQIITRDNLTFVNIEKDMLELQRNVLVYSYVGYRGVLKKIDFIKTSLEEKFEKIELIVNGDNEISDRFDRMLNHYHNYTKGFDSAVKEKQAIKNLTDNEMHSHINATNIQLKKIQTQLVKYKNYEAAYQIANIEHDLFQASSNILAFGKSPDSLLVSETRQLFKKVKTQIVKLKNERANIELVNQIDLFLDTLNKYQTTFKKLIRLNSNYIHLINVVMAGKAAEIESLSKELDMLITQRSDVLASRINDNIIDSQKRFVFLAIIACLVGFISSFFISHGIANPVKAMADTLSKLSKGKSDIEIPGLQRADEVGEMASAANEFKIMAKRLSNQTAELEEFAYRTSHDLRSPLVSSIALLGITQKSLEAKKYDKAEKSISLVKSSLTKLESLVRDILELTKTKNIKEDKQPIDLNQIISDTIDNIKHMDNFERLSIEIDLQYNQPIVSHKSRFTLIIENLISNAVKYQDTNKASAFIKITNFKADGHIVITIEDNGIGIPKNQQENMFSMFQRFHPKVSFGSGLGLYMMKKSVDVLGGKITYEDTGDGSKFSVRIPV